MKLIFRSFDALFDVYNQIFLLNSDIRPITYKLLKGFDSNSIVMEIFIDSEPINADDLINVLPLGLYSSISTHKLEMFFD